MDTDVINKFENLIEYSDENFGNYISKFLGIYQIQKSRLRTINEEIKAKSNHKQVQSKIKTQMHNIAELYCIAKELMVYSRHGEKTAPFKGPTQEDLRSSLSYFELFVIKNSNPFSERYVNESPPYELIWDQL